MLKTRHIPPTSLVRPRTTCPRIRRHFHHSPTEPLQLVHDLHKPTQGPADPAHSPILFLHGLFGGKRNYQSISKKLAQDLGRCIYAIDLRNHGDSPSSRRHDYGVMASDIVHLIQSKNLSDPTIIGHSMGAKVAMAVALQEPSMVKDIVAVDNAPVDGVLSPEFAHYVRGMQEVNATGVKTRAQAEKIMLKYEKSLPIIQFLLTNLTPSPSGTLVFGDNVVILGRSLADVGDFPFKDAQQARFDKRALFVRGTRSRYVPDEVLPMIGSFFPRFELADIDAGHWVISEKPEAFREAILRFLRPQE